MALKQVLITKRKEGYLAQLAERRQKNDDIQQRKAEMQKRKAFLTNPDIKDFLQRLRDFKGQTRVVTGQELLVPEVGLDLLHQKAPDGDLA